MKRIVKLKNFILIALILSLVSGAFVLAAQEQEQRAVRRRVRLATTVSDCSFLNNPDEFKVDPEARFSRVTKLTAGISNYTGELNAATTLDATFVPRKTFIDSAIFDRMASAGIPSAPLATDEEFMRRLTLDLTGRIPSAAALNAFLADTNPSKRDALVDSLIGSPDFVDKWTNFFGDLYRNSSNSTAATGSIGGRDAFFIYLKDAVLRNKPYDQMAREIISGTGDNFIQGEANFTVRGNITMGPAQDTYDGQAAAFAQAFLGIGSADCLLCHDGARHLDTVNLWGSRQTRVNLWGLSAYFARTQMARQTNGNYLVTDNTTGEYRLNTTTGNRTARQPVGGVTIAAVKNPFVMVMGPNLGNSGVMAGETRRQALARQTIPNIQFSRAIVNYVWEKFMVEAFVTPSNQLDPARLDSNAPPTGWPLQATNTELFNDMAIWFRNNGYDIRALMALITKSNAYQLSSTYPGNWRVDYVPYYARKYVRRLEAEEVHDAIQQATGILNTYTFTAPTGGLPLPAVQWAMQLPEPSEPRSNGGVATFLNSFGRGDRDATLRRTDGSLTQGLNMMNNGFVMNRIHQTNAGSNVATILAQTQDPATIVRTLFQNTLSRNPTPQESALFVQSFTTQTVRAATETLQWVLLNKLDFIFNY